MILKTGRISIGFPERQTDTEFLNEYLKTIAEHTGEALIWLIIKRPRGYFETPEIWDIHFEPPPAEACQNK